MKTALCTIVKNENRYLLEFINYYIKLGFTHIFIYDNNDINGETIDWLYNIFNNALITIINYRGEYKPLLKAYKDCYINNYKNYDWIAFFDCDEFLYLTKDNTITDYLSRPIFNNFNAILLNWKNYGDNDLLGNENNYDRSVLTRFNKPINKIAPLDLLNNVGYSDTVCKKIVRCIDLVDNNLIEITSPHRMFIYTYDCTCDNIGNKVNDVKILPDFNNALCYLKHYCTKTIIEYIEQKVGRGAVCSKNDPYNIDRFFEHNTKTTEKINLVNKLLNI